MSYNEQRISGEFYFANRQRKVYYDAYPDRIEVDETAWIRHPDGSWSAQELQRCLVNIDLPQTYLEEMIAEEVGY